ncbi:IS3 family transposase [Micromonospora aurantiaca (nom. illeg.)]|uniref:IS3 family transposase n=1 Tax=Micromonospora aurantiaca (nom. illeg.) TaxID=47850 RepID=UPI00367D05DB
MHQMSRGTYGSPRVHAELRLAAGGAVRPQTVERLMRTHGLQGVYRRRRHGCTVRNPHASPSADLVNWRFAAGRPDALWVTVITTALSADVPGRPLRGNLRRRHQLKPGAARWALPRVT